MGDRTALQVIIYDCPPHRVNTVLDVLNEHGLDETWSGSAVVDNRTLNLCSVYGETEARGDESEDVARELQAAAPEVTFLTWTDPAYEWLGSLVAYAPDLGEFTAECDSDGHPQFTMFDIHGLLSGHRDKTVAQFVDEVLPLAAGQTWFSRFEALMTTNRDVEFERGPDKED